MSKLQILTIPASNFGRSIVMLAIEKGIDYDLQVARPHSKEVYAVHPFGNVPVVHHGDVRICESPAIARYIDSAFEGPRFFPEDPAAAANVDEWVSLHETIFDPTMIRQYALNYVFPKGEDGKPDRDSIEACLEGLAKQLAFIDGQVASGFLAQGRLTYADLAVFPTLVYMTKFPESAEMVKKSVNLEGYIASIGACDSAKATEYPSN